jgi:pimeloyl-ACP methyl ester carboxylesterase
MGLLAAPGLRHAATTTMRVLARSGISQLRDLGEVAAIYDSFKDPRARAAIRHVVRAVVDWKGQIVSMADRAYLTEAMPMCVIWGADDLVIPVSHASNASALAPTARVEIIPNAGHFPHRDHPERFAKIVRDFIRSTEPARYDRDRWRDLLDEGAPVRPAEARAGDGPLDPLDDVRHATPA